MSACPLCGCRTEGLSLRPSLVAGTPICEGCAVELSQYLELEERAPAPVLDKLESVTRVPFGEARRRYYREAVDLFRAKLAPENLGREAAAAAMITRRSVEETVTHWRAVLADYEQTLERLESL